MPGRLQRLLDSRLWLVTDREASFPRTIPQAAEKAINGGVDAVLFRLKDEPDADVFMRLAAATQYLCRQQDIPFVVSHNIKAAIQLNADALQLGTGDVPVTEAVNLCGEMPVGYSCHSVEEAKEVTGEGAAYVFLGPIFASPAKLKYGRPLGLDAVSSMERTGINSVYIGGMDKQSIPLVTAKGARRVAAIRSLQACADPQSAAAELKALLP